MVTEIRLYIEGGGETRGMQAPLREAFQTFLAPLREQARARRVGWSVVLCGGIGQTFDAFTNALEDHPNALNILLVDADAPVEDGRTPAQHLASMHQWRVQPDASKGCHLMVQVMESWFVADRQALRLFYRSALVESALPATTNIETVPKDDIMAALDKATRGSYHKGKHAPKLLGLLDCETVKAASPHCRGLFACIEAALG